MNEKLGICSCLDCSGTLICFDLYKLERIQKDRIPHIFLQVVSTENDFLCLDSSLKLFKITFSVQYLLTIAIQDQWKRTLFEYTPRKEIENCIEPICHLKIFARDQHQRGRITCVKAVISKYYPQLWHNVIEKDLECPFLSQQELLVLNELMACLMYGKSKFESRDLFSLACILHYCASEFPELTTLLETSFSESISMENVFSLVENIRNFLLDHPDSTLLRKYLTECYQFLKECETEENSEQLGPFLREINEYLEINGMNNELTKQQQSQQAQHEPQNSLGSLFYSMILK